MVNEWASCVYLADAYELLDEDPQRALNPNVIPASAIRSLKDHKSARKVLRLDDASFEIDLIAFWIMNQLDENFGASICSRGGNVLRANHATFFHPDQFFYFHLSFPLRNMAELRTIYEEYDAKRMRSSDLWDRYCCIDADTGFVKQKIQTVRHFARYFGDGTSDGDGGVFQRYVEPFLGWYVVWGEELFPGTVDELLASLGIANKHWSQDEEEPSKLAHQKKRGPKPSPAKREFQNRYPDGLPDGLSADAVAAELSAAGFPITGRSVLNYDRERKVSK